MQPKWKFVFVQHQEQLRCKQVLFRMVFACYLTYVQIKTASLSLLEIVVQHSIPFPLNTQPNPLYSFVTLTMPLHNLYHTCFSSVFLSPKTMQSLTLINSLPPQSLYFSSGRYTNKKLSSLVYRSWVCKRVCVCMRVCVCVRMRASRY